MDEREGDRQAIFGAVYRVMRSVNGSEAWQIATTKAITDAVLRAGVSHSTGEDRLAGALEVAANDVEALPRHTLLGTVDEPYDIVTVALSSVLAILRREQSFASTGEDRLDVERLRRAIYAVSVRHDWANMTDTEDRTEEIAAEYAALTPTGDTE